MRAVLLFACVLAGCEGERVEVKTVADAAVETGACDDMPGNVVPNWSFESVVGSNVASWSDSRLTPATDGADHCATYAKLIDIPEWGNMSERIPVTGAAGDTLEYGMSLQVLDGDYSEVGLILASVDDTQKSQPMRAMPREQKWVRVAGSLKLTAPVTEMILGFGTNVPRKRSLAVDRVWLVVKKP